MRTSWSSRQLLKERYGTEKFTLTSTHDLEDQIVELIPEGSVEIEPRVFQRYEGNKFKICGAP